MNTRLFCEITQKLKCQFKCDHERQNGQMTNGLLTVLEVFEQFA